MKLFRRVFLKKKKKKKKDADPRQEPSQHEQHEMKDMHSKPLAPTNNAYDNVNDVNDKDDKDEEKKEEKSEPVDAAYNQSLAFLGDEEETKMQPTKKQPFHAARCPRSMKTSNNASSNTFSNLDVSQLAGLGKASEGVQRELLSIPAGYRLENTGIRIQFNSLDSPSDAKQFRGVAYAIAISTASNTPPAHQTAASTSTNSTNKRLRSIELPRRNEPSWSGLHLHLNDEELLVIEIQQRYLNNDDDDDDENVFPWIDSFPPITLSPHKAFTVVDQDISWLKTNTPTAVVWAELALQKKRSAMFEETRGTNISSRQRKIGKAKIESTVRNIEEVESDYNMRDDLLRVDDPMTSHDIVHMKDIWNKCLGWIGMTGEHFVETLFLRCPDLLSILGDIPAELAFDMFVSIIDLTVRSLDQRTEVIARESYGVMPLRPSVDAPFATREEGFAQFAQLGMRPKHWKEARAIFIVTMTNCNPYLEENDREALAVGVDSCVYRFWTFRVMKPALVAIQELDDIFESERNKLILAKSFEPLAADKVRSGILFYQNLFRSNPEVLPFFGRTDMDFLAGHLFDAVELLTNVMNNFEKAIPILQQLGKMHDTAKIPVFAYGAIGVVLDAVLRQVLPEYGDGTEEGEHLVNLWSALMNRTVLITTRISFVSERLLRKAFEWVDQVAHELKWDSAYLAKRHLEIEEEVRMRGTYTHTEEEIVHGARVSWRNSAKCIGRIAWNTLLVRDRRHVTNLDAMFAECLEHQRLATADGSLKAIVTVFRPRQPGTRMGTRFWNPQLVRFACYEIEDGSLIGDRANKNYTDECIDFGWKPPVPRTEWDVLPIVIEDPIAGTTKMFELPEKYHKVTLISHPKYPEFAKLGLRWCVVPTVTNFTMKIGGLEYPCNPFNGWFMETEIMRDLLEPGRMDKMSAVASAVGVDPTDEEDFSWRERVTIETNRAIVYSFKRDKHTIVDHVKAAEQFLAHDAREKREGRECPAQWSWVVPAFGGSTMPIWHHEMRDFHVEPQYDYQAEIFAVRKESQVKEEDLLVTEGKEAAVEKLLIVHASVTGTAEAYAYRAKKLLRPLQVRVACCESINPKELRPKCVEGGGKYSAVLFITSTFGEGMSPPSAQNFFKDLKSLSQSALAGVPYAVMAIGSTIYPDFCQAGIDLGKALGMAGGKQLLPLTKGDEVNGQEDSVLRWIAAVGSLFDHEQKKALVASGESPADEEPDPVTVEMLKDDDERVSAAISEEHKLLPNDPSAGATARFLSGGYKLCKVTMNDELVDFSTVESKKLFRSTRYLEFDLKGVVNSRQSAPELIYETGDHARILPVNDTSVVLDMCDCLRLQPGQWVHVTIDHGPALPTSTVRLGDLLSLELNLATQQDNGNLPLLERLLQIARFSNNISAESKNELARLELMTEKINDAGHLAMVKADKAKKADHAKISSRNLRQTIKRELSIPKMSRRSSRSGLSANFEDDASNTMESLVSVTSEVLVREEGKKRAIASITEQYVTIPALLKQFPITTMTLTLADCIETLPRLKPRHYSIASSSEMCPTKLQLSVGKLTITHKSTAKDRNGVCSHFLAGTTPTINECSNNSADVRKSDVFCANNKCFVRLGLSRSTFRLPNNMMAPILMIGPGTGIAPMLGFLQAREKALSDGKKLGPCMVFFGCRAENDFLHSVRMRKWEDMGVISDLQVAFSRIPGCAKEYVQHVVARHRDAVWAMLSDPNCHYYICGDSQMAEDVFDELKTTAKTSGGLDHLDSVQFFGKMKKERRYQADVWGVVIPKKLVEKKYNQAEAWMKNFDDVKQDN